ncbi:hypothetical protein ACFQ3T_05630, partial [Saccharothrix hoggarensis]
MSGIEARPRAAVERAAIADGLAGAGLDGEAFGLFLRFFAEGARDLTARAAEGVRPPAVGVPGAPGVPGVPAPADGTTREADPSADQAPWEPDADLALASAWLDTLGLVLDPLAPLAEVGWLVEHVALLNAPLDWLAGDGDRIRDAVGRWRRAAVHLDRHARDDRDAASAADARA